MISGFWNISNSCCSENYCVIYWKCYCHIRFKSSWSSHHITVIRVVSYVITIPKCENYTFISVLVKGVKVFQPKWNRLHIIFWNLILWSLMWLKHWDMVIKTKARIKKARSVIMVGLRLDKLMSRGDVTHLVGLKLDQVIQRGDVT